MSDTDSYPPLFRPRTSPSLIVDSDEVNQKVPDFDPLPAIDFECIDHNKLDEACRAWGMFRLINHGIPPTLLHKLHDHAKTLFSLTYEHKQASFANPISYFWGTPGLTPAGVAIQRGSLAKNFNWLEGFHVLLNSLSQLQYEDPTVESFRLDFYSFVSIWTESFVRFFSCLSQVRNCSFFKHGKHFRLPLGPNRIKKGKLLWCIHFVPSSVCRP